MTSLFSPRAQDPKKNHLSRARVHIKSHLTCYMNGKLRSRMHLPSMSLELERQVCASSTINHGTQCSYIQLGVETAGELGFAYGSSKQITLVSTQMDDASVISSLFTNSHFQIASGPVILEGTPASVSKTATKQLENLQVKIKVSTKVSGTAKTPDGKTEITLSNGEKIITDLYIPTMGLIPNSSFIPEKYLNPAGFAIVDQFLRLKDAGNVWVVGDVSAVERPQYVNADKQSTHVAKNIALILKNSEPLSYKVADKSQLTSSTLQPPFSLIFFPV